MHDYIFPFQKRGSILIRYWKYYYILFRKAKVVINILHRLVLLPTWRGFFWIKPSASYYVNVNGLCVSHMAWVILHHLIYIFACYFPSFSSLFRLFRSQYYISLLLVVFYPRTTKRTNANDVFAKCYCFRYQLIVMGVQ